MVATELKRKVLSGAEFPDLPPPGREALRLSGHPGAHLRDAAASIPVDSAVHRALAASAGLPEAAPPPLEDIATALGAPRFRRLAFAFACMRAFPPADGKRLDRHAFFNHAMVRGTLAEALALHLNSRHADYAFAAGFLLDAGKLAIDHCAPQGYGKVHAMAQAKGLYILEAERIELGVDHALVGKWVAQRWDMPEPVVLCAWLHHHDTAALDPDLFPVELIDLANLADLLAHRRAAGDAGQRVPDAYEDRRRQLGLEPGDLDAVLRLPVEPLPDLAPEKHPVAAPDGVGESPHLRREARRYRGLYTFSQGAAHVTSRSELMTRAAETLRDAYGVRAGACYALEETGPNLDAVVWRADGTAPQAIALTPEEDAKAGPAEGALRALLGALSSAGAGASAAVAGLVTLPLGGEGGTRGQVVFDAADLGPPLDGETMAELLRFAGACGEALRRWDAARAREGRSETMATALLRQELNYRQTLRAERLASIGRMAAGAAHEINNPLAVIAGRAQILLSRAGSPEDAKALETIIQHSRRASKILIDLMQFARPAQPRLESAPIAHCIHQVVTTLADRLQAKGIRIVEDYASGVPTVRIDRHQMEQVFLNLIVNAEQAMEEKGGTLTLRVWHMSQRNTVAVQVTDTGHGIPADRLDRVFEPFFTAREEGKGSGLGLSVCHGIVENHRGSITVHSAPGEGATITIALPATAERAGATPRVPPAPPTPLRRPTPAQPAPPQTQTEETTAATGPEKDNRAPAHRRPCVLIADPDEALRDVLKESLRGRDCDVITASDGLEALAAFLGGHVDLLLLDITLKAVDGAPLIQQVRQRHATLPVIAFTGRDADPGPLHHYNLAACLRKPFEMRQLLHHVTTALAPRSVA